MVYSKFFIYKPLHFGNRPVLLSGQSLTGQKGPIRGP